MRRTVQIALLAVLVGSLVGPLQPAQGANRIWTVLAGPWGPLTAPFSPRDYSVVSNSFHPRTIEIAVGDTVRWEIRGFHNVFFASGQPVPPPEVREGDKTYINPKAAFPEGGKTYVGAGYRNSGIPPEFPKPINYSLTFTKAGTFRYLCVFHGPAMGGTVIVKESVPTSPDALRRSGRQALSATLQAGQRAWKSLQPQRQNNTVVVPMIGDARTGFSILRFTREPLTIQRGMTVTWVMRDPLEIHTVTFLGGQKRPEFIVVQPQKQGPPKLLVNPKAEERTKRTTYDGRGYLNSGVLYPEGTPPDLPKRFSLTFTRPGRYEYFCLVHMPVEGMKGVLIVQ